MKYVNKIFLGLLLTAYCALASAVGTTANLSWTVPSTYTSGQAMPTTDISFYTINWTGAFPGTLKVNAPAITANVPVPCGSVTFTITVTTTATALYPNTTSAASNSVPYASGVTCVPTAPVLSAS